MSTQNTKVTIEELSRISEEFKGIREEIRSAISTLNPVETVTPKGISDIKKQWIEKAKKGVFENPEFRYDEKLLRSAKAKAEELKDLQIKLLRIEHREPAKEFVWELMYSALNDAIATSALAESILLKDDVASRVAVALKYGKTNSSNLKLAHELADSIRRRGAFNEAYHDKIHMAPEDYSLLENSEIRATYIREMFEWMMTEYDRDKAWPVEILEDCSAIDVRDKSSFGHPIIAIPKSRKVNGWKLAELLGHEIECHWRNSVNAELIGALKGDDELVYEGLAVSKDNQFNQIHLGENKTPVPYYILAQELALSGKSFAEVASFIYQILPDVGNRVFKAWIYTYRTFRGVTNTENPAGYAFTKDRAYFEGFSYANELKMRKLDQYLSFGTLSRNHLEKLIELTDLKDVERSVLSDQKMQQKAIEKMLRCLRYGYAKHHEIVEAKPQIVYA